MLFALILFVLLSYVSGGTLCPERSDVYPCICINPLIARKRVETMLICQKLDTFDTLISVLPDMTVEKLYLYDSFWARRPSIIPINILNGFRIKDIEIVDTIMTNFNCPVETTCGTNYIKRFVSLNSTFHESQQCPLTVHSLASCSQNLEYLKISNGLPPDMTVKPDFFPDQMSNLKELHLPYNKISKIDKRTFTRSKFPVLELINLSNNNIKDVKLMFLSPMSLKHLDLSFNPLRSLLDFTMLPQLKTLKMVNTQMTTLLEHDWLNIPQSLMHMDLSENDFKCDCSGTKWINGTFHVNSQILGKCTAPNEVSGMNIRKAARTLIERCNSAGEIVARLPRGHRT